MVKYTGRRKGRRINRRRKVIRRYNRRMMLGNPKQKVFFFKRNVALANYLADADGADALQQYTFNLSDVPGYTEFTALFDFYKINAVKVRFIPMFSASVFSAYITTGPLSNYSNFETPTTTNPSSLRLFTCIDYNSSGALTVAEIREYNNCKYSTYLKGHKRYIKPKFDLDTRASNGAQTGKNPWVATASPTQVYNSLICGLTTSEFATSQITSNDILYKVEAVYYLSFKATK